VNDRVQNIRGRLGQRFGVLAESDTNQLRVVARNADVAVGDLFLLPSVRGPNDRFYVFRTTEYANIMNRTLEMGDLARSKLTMPDAYLSQDLSEEQLLELRGIVLGYAEHDGAEWVFHRPRRLPEHLSDVYHVRASEASSGEVMEVLLHSQLGAEGVRVGHLLAGEESLPCEVRLPTFALSHHVGIFGRTGSGKSNLMMVLLEAVLRHNRRRWQDGRVGAPASLLAIDPHDEFRHWHVSSGGRDGIHGVVQELSDRERRNLVEPFYYLSARNVGGSDLERRVVFSRADVMPSDLTSIIEFTEQQVAFANQQFSRWGEEWIGRVMMGDTEEEDDWGSVGVDFLPGTVSAVQRRLDFLRRGQTRIFTPFDPEMGFEYESLLPDILCALEQGRVMIVDTTLMSELEQFLLNTIIARSLFGLRRALRTAVSPEDLESAIRQAFGHDESSGQRGLRTLADIMVDRVEDGSLPYVSGAELRSLDELPEVNIVVEEAPSVLNPDRMRHGSVFRDISRQGRKFGMGLTVISQQVSEIDSGVLTQLNTELFMNLGNETERRAAVRNASADLAGFENELRVMSRGQAILCASYRDVPIPVQIPEYDRS
jgi:hypothetical protein